MKKFTLLVFGLLLGQMLFAQNYYVLQKTGTASPYVFNGAGTNILTTGNQVLSTAQTLPFAWNFYGSPVTSYKASDNGYITFDNTASMSDENNSALPMASAPHSAIFAFWDDFTVDAASGNPDLVRSWTYGTAPNRTHCIQWWSMTRTGTTSWVYTTIRIHEGADFDVIWDYAASTAAAATSGTTGCQDATGTNGTQVSGSPAIQFPTLISDAADDKVFEFHYGTQPANDLSVISSNLVGTVAIGNNTVSGRIANMGSNPVTSFDLNYSVDGGATVTAPISGINIPANGGTYNFSHPTPWNVASGGLTFSLEIWATNVNGSPDDNPSNDRLTVSPLISALGITTTHNVLIEEFTGAWCQFCPDGQVILDNMLNNNPTRFVGVSIHDSDGMAFADGIRTAFAVGSYPSGQIDRFLFPSETQIPVSRTNWSAYATQRLNAFSPADVLIDHTWNPATRAVNVTVSADFVDYWGGDLRLILAVVEDSVTGTGTGYNQVNAYNNQAGHPYYQAGNPIVGFQHRHTLRSLPWGAMGNPGIIPASVAQNAVHSANTNFNIPAAWNADRISLVGFLYKYDADLKKGQVLNVKEVHLGEMPVAIDIPAASTTLLGVSPNPATTYGRIDVAFSEITEVRFEIQNLMGQTLTVIKEGTYAPGSHSVFFDVEDVPQGIYLAVVKANGQTFTEKVVVAK